MTTKIKQKYNYITNVIQYSIVKTRRRKTSEVTVDNDSVEIRRSPYIYPETALADILARTIFDKPLKTYKMHSNKFIRGPDGLRSHDNWLRRLMLL